MAKVFINFRNGDDPYAAALIFRALRQRFGAQALFRSTDSIAPGARWEQTIWDNHRDSAVLIAVIGPRWLTITDGAGQVKLLNEADWVRTEIAAALAQEKLVIPVLLEGVPRFTKTDLPEDLAGLAELQSVSMRHGLIDATIERLVDELSRVIGPPRPDQADETPATSQWLGVWNVPARASVAIDRSSLVEAVRAEVAQARGERPVVLQGSVGTGKSRIAIEYAHRFAGDYQAAWWISGTRPELITAGLTSLARAAGFVPEPDIVAALPALFDQLRRQGRFLLVFDGVEDPGALVPHLPAIGTGGDVVVTTRNADWGLLSATPVRIGFFDRRESVQLLTRLLGRAGSRNDTDGTDGTDDVDCDVRDPELDRLAGALDDIPLALAQAAVFLTGASMGIGEYTDLLNTRARDLLSRGETYLDAQPLSAAWSLGLELLAGSAPDAAELFDLVSVLAATPVPLSMLSSATAALSPALARTAGDPIALGDLAHAVARSGLVRIDRGALHPHSLFQAFIRQGLDADQLERLRASGRAALSSMPRADPRAPEAFAGYDVLLPHALALDLAYSDEPSGQRLLLDIVHHLVVRADPHAAHNLAQAARSRWLDRYGPDAEPVLSAAVRLAQALFRLGDYPGAEALDEDAYTRFRRQYGEDNPQTLAAAHSLAMDRWAQGSDALASRELLDQVIAQRRHILGADHHDTLRSVHDLAVMLRAADQIEAARDVDEDTCRRLRGSLGDDHPDTLRSAYALALDLRALGLLDRARTLGADTYERSRRTLGADHPDTLRCAYGCAVDARSAGDLPSALRIASDTYQRRQRVLGDDHVDTLRSAYLLGLVRSGGGDPTGDELVESAASRLALLSRAELSRRSVAPGLR